MKVLATILLLTFTFVALPTRDASANAPRSLRNISSRILFLKKLPKRIFDGTRFVRFKKGYRKAVKKLSDDILGVLRAFKAAPKADRATPEGRKMAGQLNAWLAYGRKVEAAWNKQSKGDATGDMKCDAFFKKFPNKRRWSHAMLILMGRGPSGITMQWKEIASRARQITKACAEPVFKDLGKVGCSRYKRPRSGYNPTEWCAVAPKAPSIIKAWIHKRFARTLKTWPEGRGRLARKDGWHVLNDSWSSRLAFSWAHLSMSTEDKDKLKKRIQKSYSDVGIQSPVDDSVLKPLLDRLAANRQWVQEKAATWKMPKKGKTGYALKLGKKALKNRSDMKLVRAYLEEGGWVLRKGKLKIKSDGDTELMYKPRRRRSGYLFYRVKGQKLCQLQEFQVIETWDGKKFVKGRHATLGNVRFQACGS